MLADVFVGDRAGCPGGDCCHDFDLTVLLENDRERNAEHGQ